jgi:pimeloyl-ACP methyl ester carboxylesterase
MALLVANYASPIETPAHLAFDLWGYGDSSKLTANYTFESYLELLPSFADALGIARPFSLVGHGLGAAVALRYTRLNPHDIQKVITVALPINGRQINEHLTRIGPAGFLNRYLNRISRNPELTKEVHKTDAAAVSAVIDQMSFYDFTDDLDAIESPLLMIFGKRDAVVRGKKQLDPLMNRAKTSHQLVMLDECNHFPMLEQPAVFNRLLQDFVHNDNEAEIQPKRYWQRRTR